MHIIDLKKTSADEVIKQTLVVLKAGGLVIFPTETTYGAGVCATNQDAVEKLLRYKARREGKPMSIAVTSLEMAEKYVDLTEAARQIYARFLPGPVTVVSRSLGEVAPGVASEFGTLGVRIPDYQLVIDLVKQLGVPITATSANASGEKRPYTIQDIFDGLSQKQKDLIDLVLDAGVLPPNPPSTVIDTTLSTPVIFRQGETRIISAEQKTELISHSAEQTQEIAQRFLLKYWNEVKETGVVIGLNGSLGMGKTQFVKGVAKFLKISTAITSPTYSYINEYDFTRHNVQGKLFHLDVWKIDNDEEANRLQIDQLLQQNSVVVIEWVSNISTLMSSLIKQKKSSYFEVSFQPEKSPESRTLTIVESFSKQEDKRK